jgi:hypothetical protein
VESLLELADIIVIKSIDVELHNANDLVVVVCSRGLLVLSAGTVGRISPRLFPPSPKASQSTLPRTIAPRTRDAT